MSIKKLAKALNNINEGKPIGWECPDCMQRIVNEDIIILNHQEHCEEWLNNHAQRFVRGDE